MASKQRQEKMAETRARLIAAGRKAFAAKGYAAACMDDFTAEAGLTRGALYHNFGDKRGLLAAVVEQIDSEMAARARDIGAEMDDPWAALLAEGNAYIQMALDPEVQRIVLLDGPAVLGDPSRWPSQDSCLQATTEAMTRLIAAGVVKPMDPAIAARLLSGAALNAALWVAAQDKPEEALARAQDAFAHLVGGVRAG